MSYILYGSRRSGSCIVELALAEVGATYEFRDVDLRKDRQREPEYAALNPQRKLPALSLPSREVLTESAAILLALERLHPEANLLPAMPAAALALRWMMFVATEIYPIVEINDYPERFVENPPGDAEIMRENARRIWRDRWQIVEANISGDPYLLKEGFSMTDLYIAVVSRWAQQDDWRPVNTPKVERLTRAISERDACAPVWKRHFA